MIPVVDMMAGQCRPESSYFGSSWLAVICPLEEISLRAYADPGRCNNPFNRILALPHKEQPEAHRPDFWRFASLRAVLRRSSIALPNLKAQNRSLGPRL